MNRTGDASPRRSKWGGAQPTHLKPLSPAGPVIAAAVALFVMACNLEQIDAVSPPLGSGDAATVKDAATPEDGAANGQGESPADGAAEAPSSTASACTNDAAPAQEWTFDTGIEGWILSNNTGVVASLTWSGTVGDPTPGALEVDFTPAPPDAGAGSGVWIHEEMTAGDLTGKTISAWVWLDSGPSPQFYTFVQSQDEYAWADNFAGPLPTHEWICVSLAVSTPSFSQPAYDPTHVIRIGFEMIGTAPFRIYVDTVRY